MSEIDAPGRRHARAVGRGLGDDLEAAPGDHLVERALQFERCADGRIVRDAVEGRA